MMVTIDWVARRYGVLPSHLIREGDSIDIILANLGVTYENYLNEKADSKNKNKNLDKPVPKLSEEEMLKMVQAVRSKENVNS